MCLAQTLVLIKSFQQRWDFPSKQNPAHKNVPLVDRVRALWEANVSQKDMLRILDEEGFDIKERELMRVRAKNRWLLRVPNASNTETTLETLEQSSYAEAEQHVASQNNVTADTPRLPRSDIGAQDMVSLEHNMSIDETAAIPQEVQLKRRQRLEELQIESDRRWAVKKRRRRTRGWAGLAADPPGPPRFPSETTLDESKAILHLENDVYRQAREQFQTLCEAAGFTRKTAAGPENWKTLKDTLINDNAHLYGQFFGTPGDVRLDSKALALDVICTDVTKRMRTMERRMSIADAKNTLEINPEQSRRIRDEFYALLKAEHFVSKLEAGDGDWEALKQRWIAASDILSDMQLSDGLQPEADRAKKLRALETLCRDVMKRFRDDLAKRDPTRKKQLSTGAGPRPAPPRTTRLPASAALPMHENANILVPGLPTASHDRDGLHDSIQIDPSLLAVASNPSLTVEQLHRYTEERQPYTTHMPYMTQHAPSLTVSFRLSPSSTVQNVPKMWFGTIATGSCAELRTAAVRGYHGAIVSKIGGLLVDQGAELVVPIDTDDELVAYLTYVACGKPTFSVHLEHLR